MGLKEDLEKEVKDIFRLQWTTRNGRDVPSDTSVTMGNDGIRLDATVLYADLSESTKLVDSNKDEYAAELYKAFLRCAGHIIKDLGGTITAYDGDRIMAVYLGDYKNTNAAKTGLKINWARQKIIQTAHKHQYGDSSYQLRHTVGIDTSELLVAKAGVRGSNDLVWIGRAANWAAKLTTLSHEYPTRMTKAVYVKLADEAKISSDGRNMWESRSWTPMNGTTIYRSSWRWSL